MTTIISYRIVDPTGKEELANSSIEIVDPIIKQYIYYINEGPPADIGALDTLLEIVFRESLSINPDPELKINMYNTLLVLTKFCCILCEYPDGSTITIS